MPTISKKTCFLVAAICLLAGLLVGYSFKVANKTWVASEHQSAMEIMMSDMTARLEGKKGDEFDKAFLDEMTMHHEGVVRMVRLVLTNSNRSELISLANNMISTQNREMNQMRAWQNAWFKQPVSPAPSMHMQDSTMPVACTMEARICPDGSAVGREGPNCEFAPCPRN